MPEYLIMTNFWTLGNTTMETIEAKALKNLGNIATKLFICKIHKKLYFEDCALLKVSKSRKQNTKFSHTPKKKNQRNFVYFFALASKKWLKQKIKAFDDLN